MPDDKTCPACGEAVKDSWKICPACEMPLKGPVCPGCRMPVKENWKRCPECETRLPAPDTPKTKDLPPPFVEPLTGMVFLYVPPGRFEMGDGFGDGVENEQPVHPVSLDGFYMARFQVTQTQWRSVMGENPSEFTGDDNPVENVSWHDCSAFLDRLSRSADLPGALFLPSEAMWEYAARSGGKAERYAGGDRMDELGWTGDNSGGRPRAVGQKRPNGLGLFDMSGNVWEWCADVYEEAAYQTHPARNPVWSAAGEERVLRGGSWHLDGWSARCARRFSCAPDVYGPGVGFRPVCRPGR